MADSQKSMVSIVAILAIVILVGVVVYFVMQERDDNVLEIDIGSAQAVPVMVSSLDL